MTRQCRLFIAHSSLHKVSTMALVGEEGVESPPPSSVCPDGAASSNPWARTSAIASPIARALGWRGRGICLRLSYPQNGSNIPRAVRRVNILIEDG